MANPTSTGTIRITASTELGELQKLNGALDSMQASFLKSVGAASLLNKGMGVLLSTIQEGYADLAKYSKVATQFTGDLESMRVATKGAIDNLTLMTVANRASVQGIKLTRDELAATVGAVRQLAGAMGIDATEAIEKSIMAMAKQQNRLGMTIGVTIDMIAADEKYAAAIGKTTDALTANEKATARHQEFMRVAVEKAGKLAETNTTLTGTFTKLAVAIKNSTMDLLTFINTLGRGGGKAGVQGMADAFGGSLGVAAQKIYRAAGGGGYKTWRPAYGPLPGDGFGEEEQAEWQGPAGPSDYGPSAYDIATQGGLAGGPRGKKTKPKGAGAVDKSSPFGIREWIFDSLADIDRRAAEMIEEQGKRHRALMQKQREGDVEAGGEQQRAQAGLEFKAFTAQAGREKGAGKLRDTFAGGLMGDEAYQAAIRGAEGFAIYKDMVSKTNAELQGLAEGGMKTAFSGMLELAATAASEQGNIGKMALNMLKAVSLGLANQLFAMGVAASFKSAGLAASVLGLPFAGPAAAEASIYFAGAAALGALGIGLSAASGAVGGAKPSTGAGASSGSSYRPSFGTKGSSRDLPPIVVRVTFDRNDPASESFARRKVRAELLNAGYSEAT